MQSAIKPVIECSVRAKRKGLALVSTRTIAIAWCRAAVRDESLGYRYTAAMEWRKAGERVRSETAMHEFCWRQWERLMQLPRRLATPIGETELAPASSKVVTLVPRLAAPFAEGTRIKLKLAA